jgi:hypothetical protein
MLHTSLYWTTKTVIAFQVINVKEKYPVGYIQNDVGCTEGEERFKLKECCVTWPMQLIVSTSYIQNYFIVT